MQWRKSLNKTSCIDISIGVHIDIKGHFTLWLLVERPSVSTNHDLEKPLDSLSSLHTARHGLWTVALETAPNLLQICPKSGHGDGLSTIVWVEQKARPKL